jgi:hypothetical protein
MSEAEDTDYFRKRAVEERERARTATDRSVALIHRQMAENYEQIARRPNRRGVLHMVLDPTRQDTRPA